MRVWKVQLYLASLVLQRSLQSVSSWSSVKRSISDQRDRQSRVVWCFDLTRFGPARFRPSTVSARELGTGTELRGQGRPYKYPGLARRHGHGHGYIDFHRALTTVCPIAYSKPSEFTSFTARRIVGETAVPAFELAGRDMISASI
jgi:hypothetical protein